MGENEQSGNVRCKVCDKVNHAKGYQVISPDTVSIRLLQSGIMEPHEHCMKVGIRVTIHRLLLERPTVLQEVLL